MIQPKTYIKSSLTHTFIYWSMIIKIYICKLLTLAQQEVAKGNKSQIKLVLSQNFKKLIFNIGQRLNNDKELMMQIKKKSNV